MLQFLKAHRELILPAAVATLIGAILAVVARGFAGEEEIGHYLIARYAPVQHELFLSLVGRPLVTLALTLPSQGPLWLARLASAVATGSAVYALGLVAQRTRWVSPAWMAVLFLLQPFLIAHAGTAMTEPWAAAAAAWALAGLVLRRPGILVAAVALLPLARLETVVFWPFVIAVAVHDRGWRTLVWLPVPLLLWNLGGYLTDGDPLWLLHQSNWKPYPARDALHYMKSLAWITGLGVLVPMIVGSIAGGKEALTKKAATASSEVAGARRRAWLGAGLTLAVFLGAYTILAVWHPITFGNLRYFAYAAPAVAVLAAAGVSILRRPHQKWGWIALGVAAAGAIFLWGHPLYRDFAVLQRRSYWPLGVTAAWFLLYAFPAWSRRLALPLVLTLGGLALIKDYQPTLHWKMDPEQAAVARATRMLNASLPEDVKFYASHVLAAYFRGANLYDLDEFPQVGGTFATTAPSGSLLLWETHYVVQRSPNLGVQAFVEDSTWTFLGGVVAEDSSWAGGYFLKDAGKSSRGILARGGMPLESWLSSAAMVQTGIPLSRRATHADPKNPGRWLNLALAWAAAGQDRESMAALAKAEALNPNNTEVQAFKADLFRRKKQFDHALREAKGALASRPEDPAMHYLVGRVLLDMKRRDEARPYLVRAGKDLRNRWDVQYVVGAFLYKQEDMAAAAPHLERAHQLEPRHADTAMMTAGALMRTGNPEKAIQILTAFLERDPGFDRAYFALGDLYQQGGRYAEAHRVWTEGLARTGDPQFQALLQRLAPHLDKKP